MRTKVDIFTKEIDLRASQGPNSLGRSTRSESLADGSRHLLSGMKSPLTLALQPGFKGRIIAGKEEFCSSFLQTNKSKIKVQVRASRTRAVTAHCTFWLYAGLQVGSKPSGTTRSVSLASKRFSATKPSSSSEST